MTERERYEGFIRVYGGKKYTCPEMERMRRYCIGAAKRYIEKSDRRGKK